MRHVLLPLCLFLASFGSVKSPGPAIASDKSGDEPVVLLLADPVVAPLLAVVFLQGTLTAVSENLVNPYGGELLSVNGNYYINTTLTSGTAAPDEILLSSVEDQFFKVEDALGNLLIQDFEIILMAPGNDILIMASATHVLGVCPTGQL